MLVNLKEILKIAEEKKCAIGSFNTVDMANARAIIAAAEETDSPVIIMHAQVHEEMGLCTIEEVAPMMLFYAKRAKVPVCVHLDHGTDMDYVKKGLELGFTSVMYDGSTLDEAQNIANTKHIREVADKYGASLEGEIGSMGARESGDGEATESIYTNPDDAVKFVKETGVDALACAFGTAHGLYTKQPKLDFDRLKKINEMIDVPIVMHGGSGVSDDDFRKVISLGVRKINYYTYMAKAGADAVCAMEDKTFYHDMYVCAMNAMKEDVKKAICVFNGE